MEFSVRSCAARRRSRPSPTSTALLLASAALLLASAVLLPACDSDGAPSTPSCIEDQCDSAQSRTELLDQLDGHSDPIAAYLRRAATERGTLVGDYRDILDGLGEEVGCPPASEKTFVVLSNDGYIPKTVFTRCADDPERASQLFVALPATRSGDPLDVDPQILHLSAWDPDAGVYRIYSTRPDASGELGVNVSPHFCLNCHGGPYHLPYWQPLMNEKTNPWSGWIAEPGFASQLFDEFLDPDIAAAPVYQAVTDPTLLDSASNFQPIVEAGIERVNGARMLRRDQPVDLEQALSLIEPLFCDETINFVSEIHGGGEVRASALVDRAVVQELTFLGAPEPWSFMTTQSLRLPPAGEGDPLLTLIPVRGESTVGAELGLVARGVLTPRQTLRVRALDWTHPVLSSFRCQLFQQGAERVRAGAVDEQLRGLPPDATTADLIPLLFDEVMRLDTGDRLVDLVPPPEADLLTVPDATDDAALDRLRAGDTGTFAATISQLGDQLQARVDAVDRAALWNARTLRACRAVTEYPTAPIYPDLSCP